MPVWVARAKAGIGAQIHRCVRVGFDRSTARGVRDQVALEGRDAFAHVWNDERKRATDVLACTTIGFAAAHARAGVGIRRIGEIDEQAQLLRRAFNYHERCVQIDLGTTAGPRCSWLRVHR